MDKKKIAWYIKGQKPEASKEKVPAFKMKGQGIELTTYLKVYDKELFVKHMKRAKIDTLTSFIAGKTDTEQIQTIIKRIKKETIPELSEEMLELTVLLSACAKLMKEGFEK